MIQNFSGGVEINTLFIDEGFGALDAESLDQAIEALLGVAHDDRLNRHNFSCSRIKGQNKESNRYRKKPTQGVE